MKLSKTSSTYYDEDECIFIKNPKQAAFYILNESKLIDLFSNDELELVYVFLKIDHEKCGEMWRDRKESNLIE